MSRAQAYNDILGVFSTSEWTSASGNLKVVPDNYSGNPGGSEFVRSNVILGNSVPRFNGFEYTGLIRFDIFTQGGKGPTRSAEIVDLLSSFFERKVLGLNIQTFVGNLIPRGTDPDEPQYYRVNYAVPFNYNS